MLAEPLTFRRAHEHYHQPILTAIDAAANTFYSYRYTINAWERFGFPNLDVRELRQSHLLQFRANIMSRGQSGASFDAHWARLKAILQSLLTEELIDKIPATPRISKTRTDQRERPTPEEVVRILESCDAAEWPTRCEWRRLAVTPATFWRAIYATAYLSALRRSDLWRLRWEHVGADDIRITPKKTRRYRKEVYCPNVGGLLLKALQPMRGCHASRVFPSGNRGDMVAEVQRAIAIKARVPAKRATFQAFRCAALDAWCEADERAAELIAGHGLKMAAITRRAYVGKDSQQSRAERILREAAERFPAPEGFALALDREV